MPAGRVLVVKDVAMALNRTERDIKMLARAAVDRKEPVDWPMLRNRTTKEPITDKDGLAYVVVDAPPARRGKPATRRGENPWLFRRVKPPQRITLAQRYLRPGLLLERDPKISDAIAAAAGIVPGAPVRALDGARPGEPMKLIAADDPGPVLGMLLLPEGRSSSWRPGMGDRVEVLERGTMLLPSAGPIGTGPALDLLLWDPKDLCWRGEPVEGRSLLELRGSWGLDHSSEDGEPAAVTIAGDPGLRLQWFRHPES